MADENYEEGAEEYDEDAEDEEEGGDGAAFISVKEKPPTPEDLKTLAMVTIRDSINDLLYEKLTEFKETDEYHNDIHILSLPDGFRDDQVKRAMLYHYTYKRASTSYWLFHGFLLASDDPYACNLLWYVGLLNDMEANPDDYQTFITLLAGAWPHLKIYIDEEQHEEIDGVIEQYWNYDEGTPFQLEDDGEGGHEECYEECYEEDYDDAEDEVGEYVEKKKKKKR